MNMAVDVLLIQPPTGAYRRDDRCQSRVEDQTIQIHFPPMDLAYHAAVLEKEGFSCQIRDYSTAQTPIANALLEIKTLSPRFVFFSSTQPTQTNDLSFAQQIKAVNPSIYVVLRGESVSFQDELILQAHQEVDYILRGESEETLAELVSVFQTGKGGSRTAPTIHHILGLSYRDGAQMVRTADRPFIKDLNTFPWPSRHLLNQSLYRSPETGNILTTLYAARGCPYPCIFCPAPLASGRPVRMRSPEDLVAELQHCMKAYGIQEFLFHGDTFTYSKPWVMELCQRIIATQFVYGRDLPAPSRSIRWGCNSRVDTLDHEMLVAMKKAGCWVIGFGVESGHEETLQKIRKAAKREEIVAAFRLCREVGIRSHAFFVFGFPWESQEHLEADLAFAKELDPDFFDFNIAYPLPGTELYGMVNREGLFEAEKSDQGGYAVPATRTHYLTPGQLEQWRRKALLSLYLRPAYIFRTLHQAGSPRNLVRYLRAGAKRLWQLR